MPNKQVHNEAHENADLIPVRMCNEAVYCPRLFHLEFVQGVFVPSSDTVEGASQHARAKRRGSRLRVVQGSEKPAVDPRSAVELMFALPVHRKFTSENLGVRGEVDLVEVDDGSVVVVEAKRGRAPKMAEQHWEGHVLPHRAWPADLAQLALYMAMLRDAGLPCEEGRIYYRGSDDSELVRWTPELEAFAHAVVEKARSIAQMSVAPEPLVDSPKCPRCSLHDVCLPDEHHAMRQEQTQTRRGVRKIVAGDDDRAVVHVLHPGTVMRKDGEGLVLQRRDGTKERHLLKDVSHVALFGRVGVTEPCMQHMLRTGVGVSHHTSTGRLLGITMPLATRNVALRRAQYRAADDDDTRLAVARALVVAKVRNQRTVLRRHRRGLSLLAEDVPPTDAEATDPSIPVETERPLQTVSDALRRMRISLKAAERSPDVDALRGHEGDAAASYFGVFSLLLPRPWQGDFVQRTRRPPRDRVNALLSFGYALLTREAIAAIGRVGLDPMLGLFHTMIPGRPALALDLMEPFRASWVDTAVLRLVGTGGIDRRDFHQSSAGVELSDAGRRAMIRAYERRAAERTTHPRFGYKMSYRRLIELEARILAKVLVGELETYTPMWTR